MPQATPTPRRRHRLLLSFLIAFTASGWPLPAAADDGSTSSPEVQRVALFKNGLAFITSQITLPAGATSVGLGDVPAPIHGTLWLEHDPSTPVIGIASRKETTTAMQSVDSIPDLLSANIGRMVTLMPGPLRGELQSASESLVVLRTEDGTLAVQPGRLEQVIVHGDSVVSSIQQETEQRMLRLELKKPAAGATVGISYLTRGLAWSPSYRFSLDDGARATLSAKAVLVNEVLDLEDVDVDLVTGFPHLLFGHVTSPMAPQQDLGGFLSALRQGQRSPSGNQRILAQSLSNTFTSATQLGDLGDPGDEVHTEDLFFYPVPRVSLRQGETLAVPFLQATVPYEHVYTWEIPNAFDLDRRVFVDDAAEQEEDVWHVCRFTNTTDMPLTTAPAQFVKGGQIVGQDMMRYTPVGATTSIRINRALGISAEQAEVEVDRQPLKERLHGDYYDRISVRGELKLFNGLGKPIRIEVTKSLTGELGETSGAPQKTRTTRGLREINPSHQLKWTVDIKEGHSEVVTYEYSILVRR